MDEHPSPILPHSPLPRSPLPPSTLTCRPPAPIGGAGTAEVLRSLFERIFADPDDASGVLADLDVHLVSCGLAGTSDSLADVDVDGVALATLASLGSHLAALPPRSVIGSGTGDAATLVRIRQLARLVAEVAHAESLGDLTPPDGALAPLTPAERRVVALVAGGRTNAEIAQLLQVSRRTVESQVGAAYRKLGVSSRVQLAIAAEAAGLVA